jgi:hypothetical protein
MTELLNMAMVQNFELILMAFFIKGVLSICDTNMG